MKNFFKATLFALVVLWAVHAGAQENKQTAEPENILVDQFTFVRPPLWRWVPSTEASESIAKFRIPNSQGTSTTDVRFAVSKEEPEKTTSLWETFFVPDSHLQIVRQNEKIGNYKVTWLSLTGTRVGKTKPLPNCKFVGVVIPLENRHVAVRLFGPRTQVDAATNDFRKMVQQALTER